VPGGDAVSPQSASRKQGPTSSARPRRSSPPAPPLRFLLTAKRVTFLQFPSKKTLQFPSKKKHDFFVCFFK
jgi:hypothetical protein